jgi:hypothetical protein
MYISFNTFEISPLFFKLILCFFKTGNDSSLNISSSGSKEATEPALAANQA